MAGTTATAASNATSTLDLSVGGQLDQDLTSLWLLSCAFLVFFMQSGFALLEAGTVRIKNTRNILLKNAIDACIAAIAWWATGDTFASAAPSCGGGNPFIGYHGFFSSDNSLITGGYWARWVFGFAFSATASTIVSGAVAERVQFRAYVIYTTCISAFIYPVVAHWVWSSDGWLSARRVNCDTGAPDPLFSKTTGLMDFAGSGVVHMVGGGAAFMGSVITGPRLGKFLKNGIATRFENASTANMVMGLLILWLGWYGFNAGSTGCMYGCMDIAAKAAVNTTLSMAAGGLSCLFVSIVLGNPGDIGQLLNGILAGAVSATANCAFVQSYAAVVIGMIGGVVYISSSKMLLRLKIDDPVEASPVHLFCGSWGLLAVGFFATETSTINFYGYANDWGVFYGGSGHQLGMQLLGIVIIAGWSCTLAGIIFLTLKKTNSLRVSAEAENQGLDLVMGIGTGQAFQCFNKFSQQE